MNVVQAKKLIINLLKRKSKSKNEKFFLNIADLLDEGVDKKLSFASDFEFSLNNGESNLRLLHLDFCVSGLIIRKVKKIIEKREKIINTVFQKISQKFNCHYNLKTLESFFSFNKKNGPWPIQFGFECQKNSKPKLKVYLSVNGSDFPWEEFCDRFKLNRGILNKKFKNKRFDTVAIDFSSDSGYCFKFYPLIAINKGLLCRVNKNSKIISIKKWRRFPDGLAARDKRISNFIKLPPNLYKIIENNDFKTHYLCEENGKKSVYFR